MHNLSLIPAMTPPEGVIPNFIDPQSDIYAPRLVSYLCFVLATISLVARLTTRLMVMKKMTLEDYSLLFGWVSFAIFEGFTVAATYSAAGRHQWNVNLVQMSRYLWLENIQTIVYPPAIFLTKLSILVQFQHIFVATRKGLVYWSIMIALLLNTMFYLAMLIVAIFSCTPRMKRWNPSIPGVCVNSIVSIVATAAFNFLSDILMLAIPLYAIRKLQIASNRKRGVYAIFATGILGCIASLLRLYYSTQMFYTQDITYAAVPVGLTSVAEFASLFLVACGPVLPRLYRCLRDKLNKAKRLHSNRLQIPSASLPNQSPLGYNQTGSRLSLQALRNPSATSESTWSTLHNAEDEETATDIAKVRSLK